jgi:UDPglucose--hexose-1-phosphate uridylyltransferase
VSTEMKAVYSAINSLLDYAENKKLISADDRFYSANLLISALRLDEFENIPARFAFPDCLDRLCDYACDAGIINDTQNSCDLFDTRLMGCVTPRPSDVICNFRKLYDVSKEAATDYFYALSQDCNYIRRDRVAKDERWTTGTEYGEFKISINLSKPEKDPRDIAAAKLKKASGYPKCQLCIENEGYAGTSSHPARENLRIIPIDICGERWGLQYSPYTYYNEHCIVMNSIHKPMTIDSAVFGKLFAFAEQFPHYFVGSNADLPIVGGSILSHEHFQGGRHVLPMQKAKAEFEFEVKGFEDVKCTVLNYPMTVLRLDCENKDRICALAGKILRKWRGYTDAEAFIFAETDGTPHSTITPIARMNNGLYELDLALRNNITTPEHPLGVYHPHEHLHHIKKENIGLIEVQGLAILPGRLKREMQLLQDTLLSGGDPRNIPELEKHADWAEKLMQKHPDFNAQNADKIIKDEIGLVFLEVLECAGVYKKTDEGRVALMRFLNTLNEV